jgi:TRAP-type C4-dicarboxylate transport system permease small subunit
VAKLLSSLRRGAELIGVLLFSGMFAMFILQIFTRYVLGHPFGWTSEACVIFYVWIVFWTSAFLVHERDHVAFTILYETSSSKGRRALSIVGAAALLVAFAAALPGTVDWVRFMKIEATPVTHIRFDLVYSVFVLFVAAVVARAGYDLYRLIGPNWRKEVEDPPPSQASDATAT